jgi:hypothetical protein
MNWLFICGLHRSGTTLVEQFIHAHFDVSVIRANVPQNEGQHLQDVYPTARIFGGPGKFAFAPEMHPTPPDTETAPKLRAKLLECWLPHVVGSRTHIMEKSPPNLTKIRWLRAVFPGSSFVVVVRDPRAVSLATQKWSKTSTRELLLHWQAAHTSALSQMDRDCMVIRYEDFCADPQTLVQRLLDQAALKLRPAPLPLPARFAEIRNSNQHYLESFPREALGAGVWQRFSYPLD